MYRLLACPHEGDERRRQRLLNLIEPTYAREVARRFVAVHGARLRESSTGLCTVITDWCEEVVDFASAWATPLTDMYCSAGDERADPARAATALALHIASTGREGRFTSSLREPTHLRWDRFLLPAGDWIRVEHRHGVAHVDLRLGGQRREFVTFSRINGSWRTDAVSALPSAGARAHPVLLDKTALPLGCSLEPDVDDVVAHSVTPAAIEAFSSALDLIADHAPLYTVWVERVIRDILVLNVREGHMRSGSNTSWPGLVYMSIADPVVLAENLVHEASHQYFHLLTRIEAVDDGSDHSLYYSPPTRRERPLAAILVAYHAFANVALFLQSCASLDEHASYVAARHREVLDWVGRLEVPIRRSSSLTSTGSALTQPLIERLEGSARGR